MKLELVMLPVSDLDVAKAFYVDRAGFDLDVDVRISDTFRVVQVTPPGSACSITLVHNSEAAGTVNGLHLVVADIETARADLVGRGVEASDFYHFTESGQTPGLDPKRAKYGSYLSFEDPDGNGFLVQEVPPQP